MDKYKNVSLRLPNGDLPPIGLYIHIPFCQHKCPYCDFNTYAGLEAIYAKSIDALCAELSRWKEPLRTRKISTIFFGGGTPTVLPLEQLEQLVQTIRENFNLEDDCETTAEVNPGVVDRDKFAGLYELGFNRLSMGVQSFQSEELTFLGRIHSVEDVEHAYSAGRQVGFSNINLDFIFGLPGQTAETWRNTLNRALLLNPEHLSLYSLIVERGTPLFQWVKTGRVEAPDEDVAADLFEISIDLLATAGYGHYEVSNWAKKPDLVCKHNLIYWQNDEYIGIGPGAHSHLRLQQADGSVIHKRWGNRKPVAGYIKRIQEGLSVQEFDEKLSPSVAMGETMMLGLRLLKEGVTFHRFQSLHGMDLRQVFGAELEDLQREELIWVDRERVRLSKTGLMFGNQVFARFLPSENEPMLLST